ncbi:hypothetical protein N0V85_007641 [Neurospora sp. IMI 360204]|nr:hypothetical protein N0V85_007641 [Neurospora sp. IMI 360204]
MSSVQGNNTPSRAERADGDKPLDMGLVKLVDDHLQEQGIDQLEEFKRRPGFLPQFVRALLSNYEDAKEKIARLEEEVKLRTEIMESQTALIKVLEEKADKK